MSVPMQINPEEMRAVAQAIHYLGDDAQSIQNRLQTQWQRLDAGWESYAREDLNGRFHHTMREMTVMTVYFLQIGNSLKETVDFLQNADIKAAALFNNDQIGDVLGISTAQGINSPLSPMAMGGKRPRIVLASMGLSLNDNGVASGSWESLLQQEVALKQQISQLEEQTKGGLPLNEIDAEINSIDEKIADLEAKKQAAEAEAEKLHNQLIPDWPLEWDEEDGVPWRVRSDDLEDEIGRYQQEIQTLHNEREQLLQHKNDLQDLEQLYENRDAVSQGIQEKMAKYDGSSYAGGLDSTYGKPGQHPVNAPVTSTSGSRDSRLYQTAINQFGVENNPRYARDNYTYCNTFAGDVARAMDVPFPQKNEFGMNPQDPATIGFPQLWNYFTDSNAPVTAAQDGWRSIGMNELNQLEHHVNSGKMAIAVNDGHIAVIRPGQQIESFYDIQIAQAGATNTNSATLRTGFGNTSTPQIFVID